MGSMENGPPLPSAPSSGGDETTAGLPGTGGADGFGGRQQVSRDRIDGQPLYPLSFEVKRMLRTLYDPRIRHDMAKTEAMTQARAIIVGLLRVVDQQGEGALYQR